MNLFLKLLFSIVIGSVSGCVFTDRLPAVHDFGVNQARPENQSSITLTTISVEAPKWLMDNRIRYRLLYADPTLVRFYTMDRWIAPPSELMQQYLRTAKHPLKSSLQLKLFNFEQQFITPDRAKMIIAFRIEVFDVDGQQNISAKEFNLERWTVSPDAKGAVKATSELIHQASNQIDRWLNELSQQTETKIPGS